MQCEIARCDSVLYCSGTYTMVVPARDDPIPGVATRATLLVAPTCFHAVASAVSKSPLMVPVAVADSDGIRWRTGTTNGGNLYGGTAPTSPLQMLQSLFVAAKQIDEPPLRAAGQNESRHLALLWKDTSSMQIETESFHIFREQFRRVVPAGTLPERCDATIYYCGDNPWGSTLFTVNNSELCRHTVNEALEYLAGLAEPNYNDTTLRTALEQSQSGVLALAVLHLHRDLGVTFAPVTSVLGFVEEQFGSMPEAVPQQHAEQFEFWPTKGGQGLLRRCTHMQLQAQESGEGCCFQLSECSDPSGLADRRLRGVVTADRAPTERTLEVQFQFWATIPAALADSGELVIQYVNDKAHRLEPERYQTARLRDSAATLPPLAAEQLVQLEQSCLELMDDEERAPLRSEPDRQKALAVLAAAHKTFVHMLEPLYGEHPLTKSLASAKAVFLQRFLRLQQRLYRYPNDEETSMPPSSLYPGAERPRKKMCHRFSLPPSQAVRMASVGTGCLNGVSSSPLSTVASAAHTMTN